MREIFFRKKAKIGKTRPLLKKKFLAKKAGGVKDPVFQKKNFWQKMAVGHYSRIKESYMFAPAHKVLRGFLRPLSIYTI